MSSLRTLSNEEKYRLSMAVTTFALLLTAPISWNYFDLHLFMLTWSDSVGAHWNVYVSGNSNYPPVATYLFIAFERLARATVDNPFVRLTSFAEINWVRIIVRLPLLAGYLVTGELLYRRYGWSAAKYWLFTYPALAAALLVAVHPAFTLLTALSWTALVPLSVFFGYQFELLTVPLSVLAMISLLDDRPYFFGCFLAIGALVKFYPVLLLPLGLMRFGWRNQARASAVFCGIIGIVSLPFVLSAPMEFYYQLFGFQADRYPQGLSPFHLPLLFLQYEVSQFPTMLRWLWQLLWIPCYGILLVVCWQRHDEQAVVAAFAAVLLSLTALNKIGNLNYMLWSWPFLLVLVANGWVSLRYVTAIVLTTLTYPLVVYLPAAIANEPIFIVQELEWYDARWLLVESFQGIGQESMTDSLRFLETHLSGVASTMYQARFTVLAAIIVVHGLFHAVVLYQLISVLRARAAVAETVTQVRQGPAVFARSVLLPSGSEESERH